MKDRGTYDDRQINAKLAACANCGRPWYFTDHKQTVCLACREGRMTD